MVELVVMSRFTVTLKLKSSPTIDFGPPLQILINLKSKSCKQRFNRGHKKRERN